MPTKADHVRALASLCRQFGGHLAVISQSEFDVLFNQRADHVYGGKELNEAPFTDAHGLWWRKKIIYAVRGRECVNNIIHEMGHVFAAVHHPDCSCRSCHEWNWFGWEIALARKIGAARAWSRHNAHYQTEEDGGLWGKLTAKRRRSVVADRLAYARRYGFLGAAGEPRSVR